MDRAQENGQRFRLESNWGGGCGSVAWHYDDCGRFGFVEASHVHMIEICCANEVICAIRVSGRST